MNDVNYPCEDCPDYEFCDGWDAEFCCKLCQYLGNEHCEECDPMDI